MTEKELSDIWIILGCLLIIALVTVARWRKSPDWEYIPPTKTNIIAALDTIFVAVVSFFVISKTSTGNTVFVLGTCCLWAFIIVSAHIRKGLHYSVKELLDFYTSVSLFDVILMRVPHEKLHPPGCNCERPDVEQIPTNSTHSNPSFMGKVLGVLLGVVGYVLLLVPTLLTTVAIKTSALIFWPVLYIGLSFDINDYNMLGGELKSKYISSFKTLTIMLSAMSILFFIVKLVVYSAWNSIGPFWESASFLRIIDRPFAPLSFYPWHIASLINGLLTIALYVSVDSYIFKVSEGAVTNESIKYYLITRAGFRLRSILSVYNWICLIFLILPQMQHFDFPPITMQLFPKV